MRFSLFVFVDGRLFCLSPPGRQLTLLPVPQGISRSPIVVLVPVSQPRHSVVVSGFRGEKLSSRCVKTSEKTQWGSPREIELENEKMKAVGWLVGRKRLETAARASYRERRFQDAQTAVRSGRVVVQAWTNWAFWRGWGTAKNG